MKKYDSSLVTIAILARRASNIHAWAWQSVARRRHKWKSSCHRWRQSWADERTKDNVACGRLAAQSLWLQAWWNWWESQRDRKVVWGKICHRANCQRWGSIDVRQTFDGLKLGALERDAKRCSKKRKEGGRKINEKKRNDTARLDHSIILFKYSTIRHNATEDLPHRGTR